MTSANVPSIKKLAIRGAVWTILGYGASQILRFGSNIILTRLLEPELFGLMGLVYVFITGLQLFSDLGINANIIQSKRGDDPAFLNTAWTVSILRGIVLWICSVIIAYPAAQIYNEPQLLKLIPIVGLNAVIGGFNSTSLVSLNRSLSVKTLAIFELSSQLVSLTVMLIWAWINPSIWALVVGGMVSVLFQLVVSHRLNPGVRNRITWDRDAVRELISFGKWVFLSTMMTFLSNQSDRLILGTLFTFKLLGIYGIAFILSEIPRSILLAISSKVIYPTYSKLIDLPRQEFHTKVLHNRAPIVIVLAVCLASLVGLGDLIVQFLYNEEYSTDASWMLPLLALGTWPLMLTQTVDPILFALGKPYYAAFGFFLSFLCYIIGIPLGFHSSLGAVGAVLAVACSNIPIWVVISYALNREKLSMVKQDVILTALFLGFLSTIIMARSMMGLGTPFQILLNQ